jgi:preprotein translocase subunit YajC
MKFVSKVLENVENIQSFYIIGLIIFIALFIWILIRTIKMTKKETNEIKNSIFD